MYINKSLHLLALQKCKLMMKTLLIIAVIYCTNDAVGNDISNFQDTIAESIKNTQESIKSDLHYISITAQSSPDIFKEFVEDVVSEIFTINKLESRIPALQMIEDQGYPAESHYLTTSDGYILNMYRIPHGKSKNKLNKVVYLQHGLTTASTDFVILGEKQGLAYILADEGYDVWLGNCRGNFYSRNHTKWNPDRDAEFWQFSWHEIGMVDTPEMIDYILEKTGNETLFHIGYSQGTTSFYVMASMRPEYNAKIQHHISLSPIAFMNHIFSPLLRPLTLGVDPISTVLKLVGYNEFIPNEGFLNLLIHNFCSHSIGKVLCKYALFATFGFSPNQFNASSLPLFVAHYPAGASTKQVIHYLQEVKSGKFCQFDLGPLNNKATYNQVTPPSYELSKITAPVTLICSDNDWVSAVVDVDRLSKQLGNLKEMHLVPIKTWNHMDYVVGNDAPSVVYNKVITILSEASNV